MEIIDAQLHEPMPAGQWTLDDEAGVALAVELTVAAMDAAGVEGAILCSARAPYANAAVSHFPRRLAALAEYDYGDPAIEDLVAQVSDKPGIVGLRMVLTARPGMLERLQAAEFDRFFAAAEAHAVPLCLFVSGALPVVSGIAEAHTGLTLVIDHFGLRQPPLQQPDDPPFRRLDELLALARHPNVAVKFSGAPTLSREPYPYRDLWPALHRVLERFGPERLMWGTDIQRVWGHYRVEAGVRHVPDPPGRHSYAEAVGFVLHSSEISYSDKELLLGGTLRAVFRWPSPADG